MSVPPPVRAGEPPVHGGSAGLVTRAVAVGIDVFVIDVLAILVGGAINLIASAFGHQGSITPLQAIIGGFAWLVWSGLYFMVFWTVTGQTPGAHLLGIRVWSTDGDRIKVRQAFRRFWAMLLAALPLGAGFVPVLFDDQRRGLHDRIAKTVVRWDEGEEVTAVPVEPVAVTPVAALPTGGADAAGAVPAGHAPTA
jgi:uncharacterized RDD family membrane protein YckC